MNWRSSLEDLFYNYFDSLKRYKETVIDSFVHNEYKMGKM